MKKLGIPLALLLFVLVALGTVSGQGQVVVLEPGESLLECFDGSRPEFTVGAEVDSALCPNEPAPTEEPPTATPVPPEPTEDPGPTPTEVPPEPTDTPPAPEPTEVPPQPTSTPPSTGIRDGVPLCASHDPAAWHDMYEESLDCHYDHHHGADPADPAIVALLGDPYQYLGRGISYPWETPSENLLKHRAYAWIVQINDPCVFAGYADLCVKAYRAQLHADYGALGWVTNTHSFWIEVLACDTNNQCGILKFGGHVDTGFSYSPYFGSCVDTPGNPGPLSSCPPFRNGQAYRFLDGPSEARRARLYDGPIGAGWDARRYNNFVYVNRANDGWVFLNDPSDYTTTEYICPNQDFQCRYNGSLQNLILIDVKRPAGSVNGFTDLRGNLDPSCTAVSPNCVPYVQENYPGGKAVYARALQFPGVPSRADYIYHEYDQSPAQLGLGQEWWIVPTNYQYP